MTDHDYWPLFHSSKKAVRYTKADFSKANTMTRQFFPCYCPDDTPYLGTVKSHSSFGLCHKSSTTAPAVIPLSAVITASETDIGKDFGYHVQRLNQSCNLVHKDYTKRWKGSHAIPSKFKVMTYNLWGGVCHPKSQEQVSSIQKTISLRMAAVASEILANDPDLVCLQEMTDRSVTEIDHYIGHIYKYRSEQSLDEKHIKKRRNRNVEIFLFSKYCPKRVTIYSIGGNLFYNNSIMVIRFDNLVVFNCYMQSGSKFSPGQEPYWVHYSRCRQQEYRTLRHLLDKYTLTRKPKHRQRHRHMPVPVIVTGDFNADLDGDRWNWPEITELAKMGLIDVWTELKPDDTGYTEDTKINHMRWNYKFIEKQVRFDGIFYTDTVLPPRLLAVDIKIVGTTPFAISPAISDLVYRFMIPNTNTKETQIKYYNPEQRLLALWPSDHFGIVATFQITHDL